MKCNDCINLLETYLDGEASEHDTESVRTHLMTCSACANELEALTAENELYARYDRELPVSPAVWNGIAARIATETPLVAAREHRDLRGWFAGLFAVPRFGLAFAGALAALLAIVTAGYFFLTAPSQQQVYQAMSGPLRATSLGSKGTQEPPVAPFVAVIGNEPPIKKNGDRAGSPPKHPGPLVDDPGVLFDAADIEEKDTANHLEQAQKLLVSFRALPSDDDQDVDVTYEKAESRRLLSENVVLRRDAETAGKFPTKSVLGSLEPFLIDIANLPDKAPANDVRQIKDRVQRTEIVAELRSY